MATRAAARMIAWVHRYNALRRHSTLGLTPWNGKVVTNRTASITPWPHNHGVRSTGSRDGTSHRLKCSAWEIKRPDFCHRGCAAFGHAPPCHISQAMCSTTGAGLDGSLITSQQTNTWVMTQILTQS